MRLLGEEIFLFFFLSMNLSTLVQAKKESPLHQQDANMHEEGI